MDCQLHDQQNKCTVSKTDANNCTVSKINAQSADTNKCTVSETKECKLIHTHTHTHTYIILTVSLFYSLPNVGDLLMPYFDHMS